MSFYGFIIGLSVSLGIYLFEKSNTLIPKKLVNFFVFGFLISLLIGARLYHVFDQWNYYSQNLLQILNTRGGGLGIYGALIAGFMFLLFFAKIYKIPFLKITDLLTPILPLCQSIGRFGNFFNHEIPTWWLEASLNLLLFFLLKKSKNPTAHYLIAYGLIRFFIEFFRNDTWTINHLKIAQLISFICIFFGLFLLQKPRRIGD
ncbi:MAG: prolipoprotein diacylglyceryl transferase family protein [Patescibacteria group bacterium]